MNGRQPLPQRPIVGPWTSARTARQQDSVLNVNRPADRGSVTRMVRPSGPSFASRNSRGYVRYPGVRGRPVFRSPAHRGSRAELIPMNAYQRFGNSSSASIPRVSVTQNFISAFPSHMAPSVGSLNGSAPMHSSNYDLGNGSSLHIQTTPQPPVDQQRFSTFSHGPTAQTPHWNPSLEYINSDIIRDRGLISGFAHQPYGYPSTVQGAANGLPYSPSRNPRAESSVYMDVTGVAHQLPVYSSANFTSTNTVPENRRKTSETLQMEQPPYIPLPIDTYDPDSPHYRYKDELIRISEMDKIGGSVAHILEKLNLRLKRVLHKICPCFYALFYSQEKEFTIYKAILGFPFGLVVGMMFYFCVIDRLKLSAFLRFLLGSVTLLIVSMGYARSIKIRCMVWLIFPCFFGKSGRGILMTMAIGALLTGPISNTMDNFKESVRTVTCMTELMINITVKRFELTGKPIFNIVKGIVGAKKMDDIAGGMRKALSPIKGEVEDTKETKEAEVRAVRLDAEMGTNRNDFFRNNEKKNAAVLAKEDGGKNSKAFKTDTSYLKKLDYRCNNIWGMAVDTCKRGFAGAWDRCLSAIPVIGYLICWPTKLDFFCYLVKLFPMPIKCDSSKMLNSGFGGAYGEGDDAGSELEKGMDVKLEYSVKPKDGKVDAVNIQDVQKGMKNEFGKKQRFFNFIITICQRIMAFAFIQIFITSFQYYNSYTSSIKFDNCYMTDYFRRIERRRRQRGRASLVPLKKLEGKVLIEPTKWRLLPGEQKKFSKGTLRLIINMMLFVLIFLFDRLIYEILDIVARHSYVVYTQKGMHDIKLEVIGTGMLAKLVKSILKGFHERHEIDHKFDNLICLPYPTKTPDIFYVKVFGTIGVIWVMLYFEAYGLRLRRCICSFFFPKREKQRVLNLYNFTLKKRAGYARSIRHQVRRLAREHHLTMEYDTFTALRQQCPYLCGWLKLFGKGKASCTACKEKEDSTFHHCETPDCTFVYCLSCWDDLRHHCYGCTAESGDDESSLSEGIFDSENDAHEAADD